jgi:MarR family transcriptional regulator, organic hydroperoxide resistance regulator
LKDPDTLDFALVQVAHLHHHRVHELLEGLGLYRGQPPVLFALWEQEGLTHSELAGRLHNTPATTTRMLQRMENAGFITRRADAVDQRVSRVYLTESGRAVQSRVEAVLQTIEAETFAGFNPEECAQLHRFLNRLRDNLRMAIGEKTA